MTLYEWAEMIRAAGKHLPDELDDTYKYYFWRAVEHSKIMAVAVVTIPLASFAVYIRDIPGICHEEEWPLVRYHGNIVPEKLARALFPQLFCCDDIGYGRE